MDSIQEVITKRGRPKTIKDASLRKKEYDRQRYLENKEYYNSKENTERTSQLSKKCRDLYKLVKQAMEENCVVFDEKYSEQIKELMK